MKIKILGTSSGWPFPRLGCSCSICSSANPKDKRLRPCLIVDNILIDAGPDLYHQLLKFHIKKFNAILLTHSHSDHVLGLHDIPPKKVPTLQTLPLYCTETTWKKLKKIFDQLEFEKHLIKENDQFKINNLKFQTFPVIHTSSTIGLIINRKLAYIPDIRRPTPLVEKNLKNIQTAILDGSMLEHPFPLWSEKWGHWSILDALKLAKKLKIKQVYFTHIGHTTLPHQQLNQFLKKHSKIKAEACYDGMELEI